MWKEIGISIRKEVTKSFTNNGFRSTATGGECSVNLLPRLAVKGILMGALAACARPPQEPKTCNFPQCDYRAEYDYYAKNSLTGIVESQPRTTHRDGVVNFGQPCPQLLDVTSSDHQAVEKATVRECHLTPR